MKHSNHFLTTASMIGLCCGAYAQQSYDTETYWQSHEGTIAGVGAGGALNMGQSFFTPSVGGYTTLDDFSFLIRAYVGPQGQTSATDTFQASVYQWNGSATIGSALATINLGSETFTSTDFTQVKINTNVQLTTGDEYIAVLADTSRNSDYYFGWVPAPGPAGDGGGNVVFNNGAWISQSGDMAWHADFSKPGAAPEPFTVGIGIAGIALAVRRRARRTTATSEKSFGDRDFNMQ